MRKALVPFLVLGLLLLGVSPVMAAAEQAKAVLPAQQDEVVQVVVPEGEQLVDKELQEVQGEWGVVGYIAARGLIGAVTGAVVGAIKSYAEKGRIDPKDVALGALAGVAMGISGGISSLLKKP